MLAFISILIKKDLNLLYIDRVILDFIIIT